MATSDKPWTFGYLLRRYRVAAELSQEELAERAALSQRGISDLERGKRQLPLPLQCGASSTRWTWLTVTVRR